MVKRHRKSIRVKLFLTYSAVLSVIVLGFAVALFAVLTGTYSDTMKNNQVELTSQMISKIDGYLSEMDTIARVAAGNTRLLSYFIDLTDRDEPGNYFEKKLIDGVDAGSILTNINGRHHTVDRISVYNKKSDYISTGILYETKQKNGHDLPIDDWIDTAKSKGYLVTGPHKDFWSDLSDPLVSIIRPLSNSNGSVSYGVVEVQRRFSRLETLLTFETQQGLIMVIFDESGTPLYASEPDWRDSEGFGERIIQNPGIQTLTTSSNGSAVYGHSSISGWSIMLMYSPNALFHTYRAAFIVLTAGIVLLLAALIILIYFISDRLSRPIRKLSDSIRNIDLQNLRLDFSDLGQDEVYDIQLAFETFVSRLSKSAALEMDAHMFALQSQINPHFLYNSLSVISAAGYESGNEEITDICARLSSMLRYAASHSDSNITLADELEHMRSYLELMKKRYEEDFTYTVSVNGDPTRVKSPKLILQPIVENCFQHGFKGVAPPWHIDVMTDISPNQWTVIIRDNGVGIPAETAEKICSQLDYYRQSNVFPKLSPGGTGVINTTVRLFLSYGKDSVFSIGSNDETGTKVVIGGKI